MCEADGIRGQRFFPVPVKARLVRRLNRFVVLCDLGGQPVTAHLPNPGRLWELFFPGCVLYLVEEAPVAARRTRFTVVAAQRDGVPVMLHTGVTNQVVRRLLEQRRIPGWENARVVQAEVYQDDSRFDFLLQRNGQPFYLEVKSCTLFEDNLAMFPDAVTARGTKHVAKLAALAGQGVPCGVLFVVQWPRAEFFLPDYHIDWQFARQLYAARDDLTVKAVSVAWQPDLSLGEPVRQVAIPWDFLAGELQDRGCYFLLLQLPTAERLTVGRLGERLFPAGYYIYVGSARRGLTQRLARHLRRRKKLFWHIDYLRGTAARCVAIPVRTADDLEHDLAKAMQRIADWQVPGFGCSDCTCTSHLFGLREDPLTSPAFIAILQYFRMGRVAARLTAAREKT